MAKVIMGIGIPASGKTTVLKELAQKYDYVYICPDDIRLERTGSALNQKRDSEVWAEAYRRVAAALAEGKTLVFDATFSSKKYRSDLINFAWEHGAEKVQGVYLDVPLEVAKERNRNRERKVPESVLEKTRKSLTDAPPDIYEGFSSVFTLDEYQKLKEVEMMGKEGEILRKVR